MFDNVLFPIIIAAAVVVLFAVAVISHTKRTQKAHYDERQLLARNAACRTSFFFLLFYCLVCGFLKLFNVIWSDIAVQMFLGVVLSLALFTALCIIKDAYFSGSQKNIFNAVIFFFSFGVFNIYYLVSGIGNGKAFWENGQISELILYAVSAFCLFALGIFSVIKIILEKRGAEK